MQLNPRTCTVLKLEYSRPPQYRPSQYRFPPNTAARFQVPNKGFVGYMLLPIPPISEYRRFFVSPEIGGIGGGGGRLYIQFFWLSFVT